MRSRFMSSPFALALATLLGLLARWAQPVGKAIPGAAGVLCLAYGLSLYSAPLFWVVAAAALLVIDWRMP